MKVIRFRAWDTEAGRMLSWDEISNRRAMFFSKNLVYEVLTNPRYVPMLETGIRDRYGVMIHDGDIVQRYNKVRFKIRWNENQFRTGFSINSGGTLTVIGHIYELDQQRAVS